MSTSESTAFSGRSGPASRTGFRCVSKLTDGSGQAPMGGGLLRPGVARPVGARPRFRGPGRAYLDTPEPTPIEGAGPDDRGQSKIDRGSIVDRGEQEREVSIRFHL